MDMVNIYAKKGIKFDRCTRDEWGRKLYVRKELRLETPQTWGGCDKEFSVIGVEIDYCSNELRVHHLQGKVPMATAVFRALLSDKDVRFLIREYQQQGERYEVFRIWSTCGVSGRKDIFKSIGKRVGGFAVTDTVRLCHISQCGKLNEGLPRLRVGDFVELAAYLGLTNDMNPKRLRRKAKACYIRPRYHEELDFYSKEVTKIL